MLCLYHFSPPYNAFQHYSILRDTEFTKCIINTVKARKGSVIIQCFGSVYEHKVNKQYIDEHSVCTEVKGVRHTFKTNAVA